MADPSKGPGSQGRHQLAARALARLGGGHVEQPAKAPKEKTKPVLDKLAEAARRWERQSTGIAPEGYELLDDVRPYRMLRKGASGHAVTALQRAMAKADVEGVPQTGLYDTATDEAVRAFQAKHGIDEGGLVGAKTLAALDKALGLETRERYGAPELDTGGLPQTGNAFIDTLTAGAVQGMHETGYPASVAIAQAVLESGWGENRATKDLNNVFAILEGEDGAAMAPSGRSADAELPEGARLKRYDSPGACVADYMRLFCQTADYQPLLRDRDLPDRFAQSLSGTYSPSPVYGKTLVRVMRQFDLHRFDRVRPEG